MSKVCVNATALLPLDISQQQHRDLTARYQWRHWTEGKSDDEITDCRRFFNRSTVAIFRPLADDDMATTSARRHINTELGAGSRWQLSAAGTPFEGLHLDCSDHSAVARVEGVSFLRVGTLSFLYLNMQVELASLEALYTVQRRMFSFFAKSRDALLPQWQNAAGTTTLIGCVEAFLGHKIGATKGYMEDWLGHELPYCLHVALDQQCAVTGVAAHLAAGANPQQPSYTLASQELEQLEQSKLAIWQQWHGLQAYHRFIFVSEAGAGALRANLYEQQYYVDLYVLALYQRIQYERFQEALSTASGATFASLSRDIQAFRQQFNLTHVCSYPLGQRLYDYLAKRLDLTRLEQRIFTEIDHHHGEVRRQQQEKYSAMLFSISVLAAIILPLNSLSALLAIDAEQRGIGFWLTAVLAGLGVLLVMFAPVVWRRLKFWA